MRRNCPNGVTRQCQSRRRNSGMYKESRWEKANQKEAQSFFWISAAPSVAVAVLHSGEPQAVNWITGKPPESELHVGSAAPAPLHHRRQQVLGEPIKP